MLRARGFLQEAIAPGVDAPNREHKVCFDARFTTAVVGTFFHAYSLTVSS
jgi:hypothetical protein